jgi:hypothetical protein
MSGLPVVSNTLRPSDARTAYLNGQSPEKKAEMIARADQVGPGRDDADWLVAKAADDAAKRIEAAAPMTAKTLEAIVERIDRIEANTEDLKRQKPAALPPIVGQSAPGDPFAGIFPLVCAFVAGAAICEAAFFALSYRWLPPVFDQVAMFVLGLSATAFVLLWLWLAPIVKAALRGR